MKCFISFFLPVIFFVMSCDNNKLPTQQGDSEKPLFEVKVLKWYNGHTAAVSINFDVLWGHWKTQEDIDYLTNEILKRNLRIDFEMVTSKFILYPSIVTQIREEVIPKGIHFFGHGHEHVAHDDYDFEYSYSSFKMNFDLMEQWGLEPRAYGYPESSGYKYTTQLANKLAGFICARGAKLDLDSLYICPDDEWEPENWYYLPSIVMGQDYPEYIYDHSEMSPILDKAIEKTAWIIIMYHSVGFPEGYGYYPLDDFLMDIDQIAANDFWGANMDMTACYIQERNRFQFDKSEISSTEKFYEYEVIFSDGLNNKIYNQPLTLEFIFDPVVPVKTMQIEPPVNSSSEFTVTDNTIRLNIIPDEKKYRIKLYKQ